MINYLEQNYGPRWLLKRSERHCKVFRVFLTKHGEEQIFRYGDDVNVHCESN